jgi:hypothetical protein
MHAVTTAEAAQKKPTNVSFEAALVAEASVVAMSRERATKTHGQYPRHFAV